MDRMLDPQLVHNSEALHCVVSPWGPIKVLGHLKVVTKTTYYLVTVQSLISEVELISKLSESSSSERGISLSTMTSL